MIKLEQIDKINSALSKFNISPDRILMFITVLLYCIGSTSFAYVLYRGDNVQPSTTSVIVKQINIKEVQ